MSVPDFQSFFLPVLRLTADGKEHPIAELRERTAADLKLSPEDLSERLPSGTRTVFSNRVAWAAVYLNRALALERPRRGVFRITVRGKELIHQNPTKINVQTLGQFPEFVAFHRGTASGSSSGGDEQVTKLPKTETPDELLAAAYKVLRESLATDVLDAVKKSTRPSLRSLSSIS